MSTKNAIDILKKWVKEDPELQLAYLEEKTNYHISCKIREYRKRAGLTQKQLAQLIETKQSVISRLEQGEYTGHSLSILKRISEALHEPIESFLGEKKQKACVFTIHIPSIIKEVTSFENRNSKQILSKRSYVR